jgi:hypothetical protein
VHTLTWLSSSEVLTVEFPDDTTEHDVPVWVVVDARTGRLRRVTPPSVEGCPSATATGPARIRDGVVAYVSHCPTTGRSRVLSYDFATTAVTELVDAGDVELEHVTVGADGRPAFVANLSGRCAGVARVLGRRLDPAPLAMPGGWDLSSALGRAECAGVGRGAYVRVDRSGKRVAFVAAAPGGASRVYVSPVAPFRPAPVGDAVLSPADLAWSGDGKALFASFREGPLLGLARIDVATGQAERLFDRAVLSLATSPDGERLAVLRPRPTTTSLQIVPVTPGP